MAYALFQTLTVQEIKDLAEACPEAKELVHSYCQFESGNLRKHQTELVSCLLYTSPSPRDLSTSRMPSSA